MFQDILTDFNLPPDFKPWKFHELKAYSSTEWLADNRKKYRQVFDRHETAYVYAELSFHNKLYDIEDWEINIELRCFTNRNGQKKEICKLPFHRRVSKNDPIGYIREGWGNRTDGVFWKRGGYHWEAWIEGERVATKLFYIEDANAVITEKDNPYVELETMHLYEGPYDDVPEFERSYLKAFDGEETRYIYAEINLQNKLPARVWHCELFIKFYNDARELKGQVTRLHKVNEGDANIKITAGWGSNVKGSWRKDKYSAEVIFMDRMIASMPFVVGMENMTGDNPVFFPDNLQGILLTPEADDLASFEEVLEILDRLIGLSDIKVKVREHAQYIQFLQLRKEKGYEENESINVHSVFIGNPGTGKTTVAKMMGRLYSKMGLLSKGHVHAVDRSDLVGEYIGQTAPKVKEAIELARGGVLFIDEAYALSRSQEDSKDFGKEVIEILVKEMSNGAGDLAVIVAGYPKEMKTFLDTNPGLRSRFKHTFEFTDYLPQELSKIAEYACKEKGVFLSKEAKLRTDEIITEAFRKRDKTFGNARFVHDVIEKIKIQMALRIMAMATPENLPKETLSVALLEDVLRVDNDVKRQLPEIPVDEALLHSAISELDGLIGMQTVKKDIREMVNLVRYYRQQGRDVLGRFFLHTVFVGNPGTGKTTVARILAKIYKALGVLERGQMVETDRQGLVAGYVGQTATKTAEKVDEAMGGVLFIDEAYALTNRGAGQRGDFGDEAIQTLLKRMEDNRGEFFIFVAGYPENMDNFLKANPGLASRFDKILRFEDYSPEEMLEIALVMFQAESYLVSEQAREHLGKYFKFLHQFRDKFFGNARTVRQVMLEAIKNQNLRLADAPKSKGKSSSKKENTDIITLDDVSTFTFDKDRLKVYQRRGIGFGK